MLELARVRRGEESSYGGGLRRIKEGNHHHQGKSQSNVNPTPYWHRDQLNQTDDQDPKEQRRQVVPNIRPTISGDGVNETHQRRDDNNRLEEGEELCAPRRSLKPCICCHRVPTVFGPTY